MVSAKMIIELKTGLHARPAGQLAELCKKTKSNISFRNGAKVVPGNSIIKLLSLGLKCGSEVEIIAEGEDEGRALLLVTDFIKELKD